MFSFFFSNVMNSTEKKSNSPFTDFPSCFLSVLPGTCWSHPLSTALPVNLCVDPCVRLSDFTHLSFRPLAPPRCGLSDAPTRCCTWSKSAWRASPCSRDWRVCSWRCSLPRVRTGSEVRAREGPRGRSPGARSDWGSHRRLSLREEGKEK